MELESFNDSPRNYSARYRAGLDLVLRDVSVEIVSLSVLGLRRGRYTSFFLEIRHEDWRLWAHWGWKIIGTL